MNPAKRRQVFERFREANPEPKGELDYATPFELLVAVILSAQSTDKGVNSVTRKLFPRANTPQKILALGAEGLTPHLQSLGLFRMKTRSVLAMCAMLIDKHGGMVPADREALQELPGVGRKTANVVLNIAFGQPTIAVDTHLFRVSNRTNIAPGADVLIVETKLNKFVPGEFKLHAHHWLILHGRYVCLARKPRCGACLIADLCEYKHKVFA